MNFPLKRKKKFDAIHSFYNERLIPPRKLRTPARWRLNATLRKGGHAKCYHGWVPFCSEKYISTLLEKYDYSLFLLKSNLQTRDCPPQDLFITMHPL